MVCINLLFYAIVALSIVSGSYADQGSEYQQVNETILSQSSYKG